MEIKGRMSARSKSAKCGRSQPNQRGGVRVETNVREDIEAKMQESVISRISS